MLTGGGPPTKSVEVDPDVLNIAPNLMNAAPVIYSSNLNNEEMKRMYLHYSKNSTLII